MNGVQFLFNDCFIVASLPCLSIPIRFLFLFGEMAGIGNTVRNKNRLPPIYRSVFGVFFLSFSPRRLIFTHAWRLIAVDRMQFTLATSLRLPLDRTQPISFANLSVQILEKCWVCVCGKICASNLLRSDSVQCNMTEITTVKPEEEKIVDGGSSYVLE